MYFLYTVKPALTVPSQKKEKNGTPKLNKKEPPNLTTFGVGELSSCREIRINKITIVKSSVFELL